MSACAPSWHIMHAMPWCIVVLFFLLEVLLGAACSCLIVTVPDMTKARKLLKKKYRATGIPYVHVHNTLAGTPLEENYTALFSTSYNSFLVTDLPAYAKSNTLGFRQQRHAAEFAPEPDCLLVPESVCYKGVLFTLANRPVHVRPPCHGASARARR